MRGAVRLGLDHVDQARDEERRGILDCAEDPDPIADPHGLGVSAAADDAGGRVLCQLQYSYAARGRLSLADVLHAVGSCAGPVLDANGFRVVQPASGGGHEAVADDESASLVTPFHPGAQG